MNIKDNIRKDDLTIYEPTFASHVQKNKCTICEGYANIHCINCSNFWLCIDHWASHKKDHDIMS